MDRYRRMMRTLRLEVKAAAKRHRKKSRPADAWFVYILRCEGGSLYTGVAKDVSARLRMHLSGRGAAYTRIHKPIAVVYQERCDGRSAALVREFQLKHIPREHKEKLVASFEGKVA